MVLHIYAMALGAGPAKRGAATRKRISLRRSARDAKLHAMLSEAAFETTDAEDAWRIDRRATRKGGLDKP
jgi:hypothetical protein